MNFLYLKDFLKWNIRLYQFSQYLTILIQLFWKFFAFFILLVYGLTVMQFDPDWVFGFARQKDASRGLTATYLVARCYPFALNWRVETATRTDSDWIIGLNRKDLSYLFDLISAGRLRAVNSVELVESMSRSPRPQPASGPAAKAVDM